MQERETFYDILCGGRFIHFLLKMWLVNYMEIMFILFNDLLINEIMFYFDLIFCIFTAV